MERNVLLVTDDLILEKTIKNYFVSKNNYNIISANDEVDITAKLSVNPEFLLIDKSDFLVVEKLLIKVKFKPISMEKRCKKREGQDPPLQILS